MVMVILCVAQVMCLQYWPPTPDHPERYGDMEITVLREEELANFHIRTLKVVRFNRILRPAGETALDGQHSELPKEVHAAMPQDKTEF